MEVLFQIALHKKDLVALLWIARTCSSTLSPPPKAGGDKEGTGRKELLKLIKAYFGNTEVIYESVLMCAFRVSSHNKY